VQTAFARRALKHQLVAAAVVGESFVASQQGRPPQEYIAEFADKVNIKQNIFNDKCFLIRLFSGIRRGFSRTLGRQRRSDEYALRRDKV